ncbi:MAG: flavin reductase family protein [Clostridiales bacterium]|nr:flavin reductase family protein [Clostridiales bacterium]
MKKNLGARPYIFPQPVLIIATYDENGKANAMNAAWGGIVGMNEVIVDLGSHKTTDNLKIKKAFTIGIADVEHTVACDYVGIASGRKVADKMEKAGFTTVKSEFVDAPVINELPLALECELVEVLDGGKYLGKIVNVSADESILGEDGDVSLDKFFPIIFDTAHSGYYRLGEKVGQAFSDGKKLM